METLPALPSTQVDNLIAQAIDRNVPVEALQSLLAMRAKLKLEYAEEQYNIAMVGFQSECPIIEKTKPVRNKHGMLLYKYAAVEKIVAQVKTLLAKHSFSYSFQTQLHESIVMATCTAKHILGHSESRDHPASITSSNDILTHSQKIAVAVTFAKRYAFCNVFGIIIGEEDTDGRVEEQETVEYITLGEIDQLSQLLVEAGIKEEVLLDKYGLTNISRLRRDTATKIIVNLRKSKL